MPPFLDVVEALAFVFHWTPETVENLDLDEAAVFYERATELVKVKANTGL